MNCTILRTGLFGLIFASSSHAQVAWDGGGANNQWTTPENWGDDTVPTIGNDYVVDGATCRSPDANNTIFDGDSLTIQNGAILNLYRTNGGGYFVVNHSIPALTVSDAEIRPQSSLGSIGHSLDTALVLNGANILNMKENSAYTMNFFFEGTLAGTGSLTVQRDATGSGRNVNFNPDASGFSGDLFFAGHNSGDTLGVNLGDVSGWGTGSVSLGHDSTLNINAAVDQPNAALSFTGTNTRLRIADVAATIGSIDGTEGAIEGNGATSSLTVTQSTDATFAGSVSYTAGNTLAFEKDGTGDLALTGAVDPAIPFTLTDGGLHLGTRTIDSLTADGGNLVIEVGTGGSDLTTITNAYTNNGGGIELQITSPPTVGAPYTIVTFGSFAGTNPPLTVTGLEGTRLMATPTYGANSISVTFTGDPADLVWDGSASGTWDINGDSNWDNGGSSDTYYEFDSVTFDDTATGTTSVVLNDSVNPAMVTFDNTIESYTLTGSGSIDGGGSLVVSGGADVTIATDNGFTGGTTISAGTLTVGNGGTTGSLGTGSIANDGSLILDRSDSFELANAISGTGDFEQAGSGTTVLTADNSFSGATVISSGTLQIGNGGTTGSLGTTSSITNDGTLVFNLDGALTITSVISGTGALVQQGPGLVILAEDMTYTGGTTISGGTLQIGDNGSVGSVVGTIVNDGELAVSRVDDIDFANDVSGSGSLLHAGTGELRLTGSNTYTGVTGVTGGGLLLLDSSGSTIPTGTGIRLSDGDLDFTDLDLVVSSLTKAPSGVSYLYANAGRTLSVQGDFLANEGSLDMIGIDELIVANPGGSFKAATVASGGSSNVYLPDIATITAASFAIGQGGPAGFGSSSSAVVELGLTNVIHADQITVGDNSAQSGSSTLRIGTGLENATLEIRATDGTGRADVLVGSKGTASDYTGGSGTIDLTATGATLDALVGTLTLGQHGGGAGNFNNPTSGSFMFNTGTLDATSIVLGVGNGPNKKTADGYLASYGGTIRTGSLVLVQDTGGDIGTATVELQESATLEATTIAGQATANAILLWGEGTLRNVTGADLTITGTTVSLPDNALVRTLETTGGNSATLAADVTVEAFLDSQLGNPIGGFALSGSLDLAGASLSLADLAVAPTALPGGTVYTLIDYTGASLSGTFAGIADGDPIVVGPNTFVLDYDDTLGGTGSFVTLTSQATSTPFESWAALNGLDGSPGKEAGFDDDPENDGITNGLEWILGGDPLANDASSLVTTTATAGGLTLEFTREESSIGEVTLSAEFDADLVAPWTSVVIGATSSGPDANGVTVTIDDAATPDNVSVSIPATADGGVDLGRMFGRLSAVE
ncbi:hypothetical protein HAHE_16150 [Haloferula helveola]|uniref:Autotransporter-associated beta strand repeat-containing protein n=1 Tax=Haloferula helveola TaxID=490095 RepID=A0ABM7RJE1_9BACT|nr:hypothetical protein HAHE_16150 [Haloferula helveola]